MAVSIAIVCEGPADLRTASGLADRVFCDEVSWLEERSLVHQREWRGADPNTSYLKWTAVKHLAKSKAVPLGKFSGEPGVADAHAARKALWLLLDANHPPDAIVLMRDDDGDLNRRKGLEQARQESSFGKPIVIGVAHPKRECWVLAGFEPRDDDERERFAKLRQELGFDPCSESERLLAQQASAKRSPKRVLRMLTGGDQERESECWQTTALKVLASRGEKNGLAEYLQEIKEQLVPRVASGGHAAQ